jgi:hypothetical protein
MTKSLVAMTLAGALAIGATFTSTETRAGDGQVAAGIVGGLAVGTILGAAVAAPRYYAPPPPPAYVAPAPVYVAPPPRCYWTYGEPVWDGWRGVWVRQRVQVCN